MFKILEHLQYESFTLGNTYDLPKTLVRLHMYSFSTLWFYFAWIRRIC